MTRKMVGHVGATAGWREAERERERVGVA